MGCVSSKVLTRSRSLQEEVTNSLQRTPTGFPVLEELLISKNGGDQFLALVCTANKVANKFQSGILDSEVDRGIKTCREIINAQELMAGLEEAQDEKKENPQENHHSPAGLEHSYDDVMRRSKSFHWSTECETSAKMGRSGINDNTGIIRSRSFHTVEEFDALMERGWSAEAREAKKLGDTVTNIRLDARANSSMVYHGFQGDDNELKDKSVMEEQLGAMGDIRHEQCPGSMRETEEKIHVTEDVAIDGSVGVIDKGPRRKAMRKGLAALQIPSTIDFPATGSIKDWFAVGGQVYSPGTYVTPKFGSFSCPVQVKGRKCGQEGGSVFHPDIVAALEEDIQELEAEEEFILKQIVENSEEVSKDRRGCLNN